jgi:hypothetical protein
MQQKYCPITVAMQGGDATFEMASAFNLTSPPEPPSDTVLVFALVWSDESALTVTALDPLDVKLQ